MAEASTNQESLTLEETNKVRASLGLAPIGGDDAEPDEDEIAEANYAERKENEKKAKEAKDIQERIAK
jgi:U4/U6.U5 tri-snRNP-associated protein 1